MIGWLFAAAILSFPVAAWVVLRRFGVDREGAGPRVAVGLLVALGLGVVGSLLNDYHLCLEGAPPLQYDLVSLPSAAAVYALGRRRRTAVTAAAILGFAFLVLLHCWTETVHARAWTGNPDLSWHLHTDPRVDRWARALRAAPGADDRDYPAGWLEGHEVLRSHPKEAELLRGLLRTQVPLPIAKAHTPLTALWAMEPRPVALWYPGGTLAAGIPGVVYRPVEE